MQEKLPKLNILHIIIDNYQRMKDKLTYFVVFTEISEHGHFGITTNIDEHVKNYIKEVIEYSKDNDKIYKKQLEDYDSNSDYYKKLYIYYQKDFKSQKLAENHIKFFESILDNHIHPIYHVYYCGLEKYLKSIDYWKMNKSPATKLIEFLNKSRGTVTNRPLSELE
jgi:hypothetical protein